MSDLLKLILSLSLSGTLLILILLLLRPLYQNRLSKRWQYYIWLVVVARLLLPITPESSLMEGFFNRLDQFELSGTDIRQMSIQDSSNSDMMEDFQSGPDTISNKLSPDNTTEREMSWSSSYDNTQTINPDADITGTDIKTNESDGKDSSQAKESPDPHDLSSDNEAELQSVRGIPEDTAGKIIAVWLFIALLLLVRKITVYQSFVKYVGAGSKPVDDIILLESFGQIMTQNHIRGTVDLRCNSLVSSPLLIGFIHPRIVLPDTELSESDFYYTILHELTHYTRRDMFYKWLIQLTVCLHWFNPFVYLMGHEANRLCELSCDERVIGSLPANARKSYGDTLLNAVGTGGSYKDTLASVTLNESKELLKGRLEAIMKYRTIPKIIQVVTVFITGILVGGAMILGAYAMPVSSTSLGGTAQDTENTAQDAEDAYISSSDSDAVSPKPDYDIQFEDGIYYIYIDGATMADRPLSNVTSGYKKLLFVRKDAYYSFGAFSDYDMLSLTNHISEQCRSMLAGGHITQEDVDIAISAATEIQEDYRSRNESSAIDRNHRYTQAAYYEQPYIIEIGYNLPVSSWNDYSSTSLTLSDNLIMPVYFSGESKGFIADENAMSAVAGLLEHMIPQKEGTAYPIEAPFIVRMEYVGDTDVNTLAEKYYGKELTYFGAVFLELDTLTQQEYLDRMFEENNISFFACCIGCLEEEEEDKLKEAVDHYILRAYQEDSVNFFAVLAGMLDEESRKWWLEKCYKEYNTNYWYILKEDDEDMHSESSQNNDYDNTVSTSPNIIDLNRMTKQDLSDSLRNKLDSLENGKWYVIDDGDCQYIYYNGLPHTYAYEPIITDNESGDLITVNISDIGINTPLLRGKKSVDNYVLLLLSYSPGNPDTNYDLTITYNKAPVTYESVT